MTHDRHDRQLGGDPPEISRLLELVAADFGFDVADLVGRRRSAPLVRARHTAALLLRRVLGLSYPQIGHALGGRDHSTAHHAVQRMISREHDRPDYRAQVARLVLLARAPRVAA